MRAVSKSKTEHRTQNGWIELTTKKSGKYANLRWSQGGKGAYLGPVIDYPTGLLDLALAVAHRLPLFELRKLQSANKSMRD
jgi:hypothetical protein